jgi:hypothetical protein
MGRREIYLKIQEERDYQQDLDVGGRILVVLNWILRE